MNSVEEGLFLEARFMRATSIVVCLVGLLLLFVSFSDAAEMRKWTRKNGKEFEAEFVKLEHQSDGKNVVTLKKPDGSEITVKMPGLSDEDRKYVKQLTKSQGNPETNDQVGQKSANQPATPTSTEMRKWTRNGKEFTAEFVKREGPVVTLKKPDGKEITVKMPGLSEEDRKYVKQMVKSQGKRRKQWPSRTEVREPACHSHKPEMRKWTRRTARSFKPSSSSVRARWSP